MANPSPSIRSATNADGPSIHDIYLRAFDHEENTAISLLAAKLLVIQSKPPTYSFVATNSGMICGHIAFSPVFLTSQSEVPAYILAPLAVDPRHQKKGIGSELVSHGLDDLRKRQVALVFVYGDPAYYGRFGFSAPTAQPYAPPYPLQYPFGWQAAILNAFVSSGPSPVQCIVPLQKPQLW